jgi:hypothetical protein
VLAPRGPNRSAIPARQSRCARARKAGTSAPRQGCCCWGGSPGLEPLVRHRLALPHGARHLVCPERFRPGPCIHRGRPDRALAGRTRAGCWRRCRLLLRLIYATHRLGRIAPCGRRVAGRPPPRKPPHRGCSGSHCRCGCFGSALGGSSAWQGLRRGGAGACQPQARSARTERSRGPCGQAAGLVFLTVPARVPHRVCRHCLLASEARRLETATAARHRQRWRRATKPSPEAAFMVAGPRRYAAVAAGGRRRPPRSRRRRGRGRTGTAGACPRPRGLEHAVACQPHVSRPCPA